MNPRYEYQEEIVLRTYFSSQELWVLFRKRDGHLKWEDTRKIKELNNLFLFDHLQKSLVESEVTKMWWSTEDKKAKKAKAIGKYGKKYVLCSLKLFFVNGMGLK